MVKSELIDALAAKIPHLEFKNVALAINCIVEQMGKSLSSGDRIEIRGFGAFSLHHRKSRIGRNPKTGEPVLLAAKYMPHFKPGKDLRDRIYFSNKTI